MTMIACEMCWLSELGRWAWVSFACVLSALPCLWYFLRRIFRRSKGKKIMGYGQELILDLHNCTVAKFTRADIEAYVIRLCELIDMTRCTLHFWDDVGVAPEERQTSPHTTGTSAIQFILTSNITIHTLSLLGSVYINIFSCKSFDAEVAAEYTQTFFDGEVITRLLIERK